MSMFLILFASPTDLWCNHNRKIWHKIVLDDGKPVQGHCNDFERVIS